MNTGLKPVWAGCNMRLDPRRLPQAACHASSDDYGEVSYTIDQRGAVIRRKLEMSGLPVTIMMPAAAFSGVAARAIVGRSRASPTSCSTQPARCARSGSP